MRGWAPRPTESIPLLRVGRSEVARVMFPPGHPRARVLYVGHPASPSVYYPMSEFHRVTFEHKFTEAVILLVSLGATRVRVACLQGRALQASLQATLQTCETAIGSDAGIKQESTQSATYEAALRGVDKPSVPKNMVWLPHESTWQMIARN